MQEALRKELALYEKRTPKSAEAHKKAAKTAIGGGRAKAFAKGYYVEPTFFYHVQNSARIAREEIFGPGVSRNTWRSSRFSSISTKRRLAGTDKL